MSHTPFKRMLSIYGDSRILLIGGEACMHVARHYGFHKAVSSFDLHNEDPGVYPLMRCSGSTPDTVAPLHLSADIQAAFIFGESINWGLDSQILSDLLVTYSGTGTGTGTGGHQSQFPIFACNADIVYSTTHQLPRYTQGAFVHAFTSLHQLYTNTTTPVKVDFCGKPFPVQYEFAEKMLLETSRRLQQGEGEGGGVLRRFYGVGDNPKSDIRGANSAGDAWKSVLVRTGIFTGSGNDSTDVADYVEDDILGAVNRILHVEKDHKDVK
jgi:HAD superfamily hydrolase (TIGR01456 family)